MLRNLLSSGNLNMCLSLLCNYFISHIVDWFWLSSFPFCYLPCAAVCAHSSVFSMLHSLFLRLLFFFQGPHCPFLKLLYFLIVYSPRPQTKEVHLLHSQIGKDPRIKKILNRAEKKFTIWMLLVQKENSQVHCRNSLSEDTRKQCLFSSHCCQSKGLSWPVK